MGVVVKIAIDEQKRIKKLLFEFYEFDFDCVSRKSPLGRARQKCILVSLYPEYHWFIGLFKLWWGRGYITSLYNLFISLVRNIFGWNIPRYISPHPNPPLVIPQITNDRRQYQLSPAQLEIANQHVNLINTQKAPIVVDFRKIADI